MAENFKRILVWRKESLDIEGSLEALIYELTSTKERLERAGAENIEVKLDYGHVGIDEIALVYMAPETNAEYSARIVRIQKERERASVEKVKIEERERKLYQKLHKKYGLKP